MTGRAVSLLGWLLGLLVHARPGWLALAAAWCLLGLAVHFHGQRRQRFYTGALRAAVLAAWGHQCAYRHCGLGPCSGELELAIDHQRPYRARHWWQLSGRTTLRNGQPLCARHNESKGNRCNNWTYIRRHARLGVLTMGIYGLRWLKAEVRMGVKAWQLTYS